jgi:xylulokinase
LHQPKTGCAEQYPEDWWNAVVSTIGTPGVVFAHTDKITIDKKGRVHTFCHAVPGIWNIMGVTQAAGLSLKWFKDTLCGLENQNSAASGVDVYEELNKEAESIKPGSDGLIYLPYG